MSLLLNWQLRRLKSKKPSNRQSAARALGRAKSGQGVDALIVALSDVDRGVREAAAAALGEIGAPRSAEPLTRLFCWSAQRSVAMPSSRSVQDKTSHKLVTNWDAATSERKVVEAALEAIGAPSVGPLIEALTDSDNPCRIVIGALGRIDLRWGESEAAKAAVPKLIQQFDAGSDDAALAFAYIRDHSVVEALRLRLRWGDFHFRRRVAKTLCNLKWKPSAAEEPMYLLLSGDWHALAMIATTSDAMLIEYMNGRDMAVAATSTLALAERKNVMAVPVLESLLDPVLQSIIKVADRSAIVRALATIGGPGAAVALVHALIHTKEDIRQQAASALERMDPDWAAREPARLAVHALERTVLATIEGRSRAPRVRAMHDPLASHQWIPPEHVYGYGDYGSAVRVLARIGTPDTVPALVSAASVG